MTYTDHGQGFWFTHFIGLNPLIVPLIARAGAHRLHSAVLSMKITLFHFVPGLCCLVHYSDLD